MKRILVTRPEAQNKSLLSAIAAQGDEAVAMPLITIEPYTKSCAEAAAIRSTIQALDEFQHLIFVSTNAATLAWAWIEQYWPQLPAQQWFGIGAATTQCLQQFNPAAVGNTTAMDSEALLQHVGLQQVAGQKILILRGRGGRDHLQQQLSLRGASVSYCELYRRQPVAYAQGDFRQLYRQGLDILTVSSAETIQKLYDQAMIDNIEKEIQSLPVVVPSLRVAGLAKDLGFKQIRQADNAGLPAMLKAINE